MEFLIVFIFGTIIGSFLNVCIYRMPRSKSIVTPRSFCPVCEHTIGWFDNVPLISFLVLMGKCRHCGSNIPARYFLVELLTALSAVLILFHYGLSASFFIYWFFTCALIAVMFIDIEFQEIPDVISIPGIGIGLLLSTVFTLGVKGSPMGSFIDSAIGIVAGAGSMFLMGMFGELVFRKEALGGGDVKLMAMIGAFLGWKLVLLTFFMAPVFGAGIGIFMRIKYKKEVIPYAPYLVIGAFICMLYGNGILNYLFFRY